VLQLAAQNGQPPGALLRLVEERAQGRQLLGSLEQRPGSCREGRWLCHRHRRTLPAARRRANTGRLNPSR